MMDGWKDENTLYLPAERTTDLNFEGKKRKKTMFGTLP